MALPLIPIAIGAVALLAIFAKSGSTNNAPSNPFSAVLDKTEERCGERMTYIDAQIFDQGMLYLKTDDVKKLIQRYESRGQKNLANCLRAKHGL